MSNLFIWALTIGMGLITFLERFSFIYLLGAREMPDWFRRALRYVPPAVLSALVLPAVLLRDGTFDITLGNLRFYAAIIAGVAAWYTKSIFVTILSGMLALWALQYLF